MQFGHLFTQQHRFQGLIMYTSEKSFDVIVSVQTTKIQICENGDIMHMHVTCSVYRHVMCFYKLASPATGLA